MCLFPLRLWFFFFNDTATTEIYTLSLHDALPILAAVAAAAARQFFHVRNAAGLLMIPYLAWLVFAATLNAAIERSEEHTSELQSRQYLVCRLLLEKKTRIAPSVPDRAIQQYRPVV